MSETPQWEYEANNPSNVGGTVAMEPMPIITILGVFRGGKLIRCEWNQAQHQLSDRTLDALITLGIAVIDEPSNHLFSGPVL